MNKIIFNNGGQPVFLDDLKVIQDLAGESLPGVLEAIVKSAVSPYLENWTSDSILGTIIPMGEITENAEGFWIAPACSCEKNDTTRKVRLTMYAGYVCIGGELLHYDQTEIEVAYGAPFYVIVKKEEEDRRILANGSEAACKECKYAVISSGASVTDECHSSAKIGSLPDAICKIIKAKNNVEVAWRNIDVTFDNLYGGTVKYQELTDCFRYHINISSRADSFGNTGKILFHVGNDIWPGGHRECVSCLFATGTTDTAYPCYIRFTKEGNALLTPVYQDGNIETSLRPDACPVNIVFEMAK